MRRAVVTGLGIVSCIGNSLAEVETSLRQGRCGIRYAEEYARYGLGSCIAGIPDVSREPQIDRKIRRFMADAAIYAHHAMRMALDDAALTQTRISDPRIGLIVGSGVGSPFEHHQAMETMRTKGLQKVLPYAVPRIMGNTTSANLATAFDIQGASYSITAACATSAHCLGHAAELIQFGKQDIVFAGGGEEVHWTSAAMFDAMGALATRYNDAPEVASRPYDADRDGFVIAGGAGVVVIEELEHARARGARIYAELAGYGATSDGRDMVAPSHDGAARAMQAALDQSGAQIDYINTHAPSTRVGDIIELEAIRRTFGSQVPMLSSTKGLTGHAIAAAGVHEAIYCLLMMDRGFVAASANIFEPDPATHGLPLVKTAVERRLDAVMSNSFGFGGTNACLVFRRVEG
jgi:3-oxoacyl-[acyl-carrier-protein] synthase-1